MSDFRIEQALAEMRAIGGQPVQQPEQDAPPVEEFSDLLRDAVEQVNERQVQSSELKDQFLRGEDVQLTDVMMAAQKADVSFEAMKEVRNQLLEAYQEIANMQV
ncbi:MAG: flagellar hook-basal body complex protein FliE [Halorhodospira halophila]|uniref:flagellar hook-basal body complex protein FliE n=1 Tax=Halorhodospira TaxID=85108 RepID=UPI0019126046|nr:MULTISPECIES: flagellar hook-basal body complex protein FliE [Halorhodospira]MBK5942822.1 flagellar hook-basal body complex protein FliE [Halorhodospira halophila]MCC3751661.1 flagellar hook-basal body complex protein FliE [Halorhodospira halophila]MCG5528810.1 flagellar hook-basal body complex protein FliE [Halorhodospira halophila]MCG5543279.1 flagellar hook-basal body complex protein FliE [Halorhodospira sp. 9628]